MNWRHPKKGRGKSEPIRIETNNWIEAIFHMVMLLRAERENGVEFADNWLVGLYQIMSRAEVRGYELPAIKTLSALLSGGLVPEEVGIYLAALEAGGWITEQDFHEVFLQSAEA